jgi:hypothetical protein
MSEMNFGTDVSDRGIFSADDLMQLQNDADGYWLAGAVERGCTLCSYTCTKTAATL